MEEKDAEDGNTVLHVAAKQGNCMMVQLLLLHGANVCFVPARDTQHTRTRFPINLASFDGVYSRISCTLTEVRAIR